MSDRIAAHAVQLAIASDRLGIAAEQVRDSSHRFEKFTKWLLVLTILLIVAAIPPAYEAIAHFLGQVHR